METISIMGCGWYGLPLAKKLAESGYHVKGSTTSQDKIGSISAIGVTPYLLILGKATEKLEDFLECDVLVINVPPGKSNQDEYLKNMTFMMRRVTNSKVAKVIYISSSSVYPNTNGMVVENDASSVKTPRSGIVMLEIENIWRQVSTKKINIIRFAGLYGPDRNPGRFLAGKTTTGGLNPINMIHLEDCIGITQIFIESDFWGETFNACAPLHPSRKEFYYKAATQFGYDLPIFQNPETTDHKIVNSDKLINLTSYQFKYPDPVASLKNL